MRKLSIMKKCTLIFLWITVTSLTVSAQFLPDRMKQINFLLNNIVRESRKLPSNEGRRIENEVFEIKRLLSQENSFEYPSNRRLRTYNAEEIKDLCARIKAAWPFRDQLELITRYSKTSSFSIRQILELIKVLDFQNNQKEVVLLLLPNTYDPENVDLLYELFWTLGDKKKINSIVDGMDQRRDF